MTGMPLTELLNATAQEFMRAFQCFMYEFWDLETKELKDLLTDEVVKSKLIGGWCVIMPEDTRICHVRRLVFLASLFRLFKVVRTSALHMRLSSPGSVACGVVRVWRPSNRTTSVLSSRTHCVLLKCVLTSHA